jgi:hypothetical protein
MSNFVSDMAKNRLIELQGFAALDQTYSTSKSSGKIAALLSAINTQESVLTNDKELLAKLESEAVEIREFLGLGFY